MKLIHHELGPANPIVQYMTPKMDDALGKFYKLTGVQLPVEQEQYPNLIFTAGALEALGGILFILNVKLGAVILVSSCGMRQAAAQTEQQPSPPAQGTV